MKQNYYLFMLLTFLTVNVIHAQFVCPELLGNQTTVTTIHYKIAGGSCSNYPNNILVTYNSYSQSFTKTSCNGSNLKYTTDGLPLPVVDSFTTYFGLAGNICQYQNGVLVTLSDNQVTLDEQVIIFPNPIMYGDDIKIKFRSNMSAKLNLYNVTGKLVLSDEVNDSDSKRMTTSNLTNGIYMLQIESDNQSATRKILIMK